MKKHRWSVIIAALILCLVAGTVIGCTEQEDDQKINNETTHILEEEIAQLMERYLLHERYTVYSSLSVDSSFSAKDEDRTYYRVANEEYDTWEEWIAFIESIFTGDALTNAEPNPYSYIEVDGYTYCRPGDMGWYISGEYKYEIIEQNDKSAIVLISRYENEPSEVGIKENELQWNYSLVMTDAGWRISSIVSRDGAASEIYTVKVYKCDDVYRDENTKTHGNATVKISAPISDYVVDSIDVLLCDDGCNQTDVLSRAFWGYAPAWKIDQYTEYKTSDGWSYTTRAYKNIVPDDIKASMIEQGAPASVYEPREYPYVLTLDETHYAVIVIKPIDEDGEKPENEGELVNGIVKSIEIQVEPVAHTADIADYKNTVYSGTDLVYEGYTVKLALPHPIYDEEILDFHIHLPQINSDSSAAVQWNKEILEKYNQKYGGELLKGAVSGEIINRFANVTFETVESGDVVTIYIINWYGILDSGSGTRSYDIYHYNTVEQEFLSTDEFLAYYAEGQFADYTVADILKFMNELAFATDEVGNPYTLTEENIDGVIPSVFGNGQFDVVYRGKGTMSSRVLFAAYPTITTTGGKNNVTADFTYRMTYPEYTSCRDKEMYGQPTGYRLSLSERSAGNYDTGYYLDCLFTEDIANPPEGYIGDFYSPVGGYTDGRMYLTVDHETDRGHVKAMIPYDHPDTAQDYYRGLHYNYFSYDRVFGGSIHQVNLNIAEQVSSVLNAYRNGEDPNLLLPASTTEYVAYPLDTIRENPDAVEINKILQTTSITSSGIINLYIDLGGGYVMGLPMKIGGFGDSWQTYFTGVYIVHGTPLFEEG